MIHTRINQGSRQRPGGGLPCYLSAAFAAQMRPDLAGSPIDTWISPQNIGIPFQFGYTCAGATAFRAVGVSAGGVSVTLSTGLLTQDCYESTKTLISYDGGALGTTLPYGLYYFEIVTDTVTVRTDHFLACTTRADNCILLQWSDSKDFCGGTYYGGAYVNKMWIDSDFARPKIEETEEIVDDGLGNKLPTYQRSEEVYGFDVIACDSQLNVLYNIAKHDTVLITSPLGGGAYAINSVRCSDTGQRQDALAVVEVNFKVDYVESTTINEPLFEVGAC